MVVAVSLSDHHSRYAISARICNHQALEPRVLVLKLLQPFGVRQVHPTILGLQLVKRRRTETMLAAQFSRRQPGLLLFDHPDNLRFGETTFPHVVCSFRLGRLYIRLRERPGGRSSVLAFELAI